MNDITRDLLKFSPNTNNLRWDIADITRAQSALKNKVSVFIVKKNGDFVKKHISQVFSIFKKLF
jgi:hypothetical protein